MSCLFNSLSRFVDDDPYTIRQKVCDYIASNKVLCDGIDNNVLCDADKDLYVDKMRKTSTWGGAIEIKAFCEIYGVSVAVHNSRGIITFHPETTSSRERIDVTWSGGHYEPRPNHKQSKPTNPLRRTVVAMSSNKRLRTVFGGR